MTIPDYALDFETYYSKSDGASVSLTGIKAYVRHPKFSAYMISVVGDDGYKFVGHPKDFDWSVLNGKHIVSHNASFDASIYEEGVKLGWWQKINHAGWDCTADLCAYFGIPRSLSSASNFLFSEEVSKEVRGKMQGKEMDSLSEEEKQELLEYALQDSVLCLRVWKELSPKWPESERLLSRHTREVVCRGIPLDEGGLCDAINHVNQEIWEREQQIPWFGEEKTLSPKALAQACRSMGIEPPKSMDKRNPDTKKWLETNGDAAPFAKATSEYRSLVALQKRLKKLQDTVVDGRAHFGLMYCAAHTRRWGGGGGAFNGQNMHNGEFFGVNLRKILKTKPGNVFISADLSQIEVRVLMYLAGDKDMLQVIRAHSDIYQAFAERFGMWTSPDIPLKTNPKVRKLVKAIVLGCGFGAYPKAFSIMSGMDMRDAAFAVDTYRRAMRPVVAFWSKCLEACKGYDGNKPQIKNVNGKPILFPPDSCYRVRLPSGNEINYRNHRVEGEEILAKVFTEKGLRDIRLWSGLLAENATQATARDIFGDMLLRIEKEFPGKIIYHIHDEVLLEVTEDEAQSVKDRLEEIMSTPPEWCKSIPLACEASISNTYE